MIGLFTTKAYAEPAAETPSCTASCSGILGAEDLIDGSHDYKAAVSLFESFPKDELLRRPGRGPARRGDRAAGARRPTQVRVLGRRDADGRTASIIVALPKARATTPRCSSACAVVRAGASTRHGRRPRGPRRGRPRPRSTSPSIAPEGGLPELSLPRRSSARSSTLTRTWDDRARDGARRPPRRRARADARRALGEAPARVLQGRRRPAPPRPTTSSASSALFTGGERVPRRPAQRAGGLTRDRRCTASAARSSSPRRCRCSSTSGLRVIEERPTRLSTATGETWLQDFGVLGPTDRPLDLDECRRPRRRLHRGRLARRGGVGLAEPAGHHAGLDWRQRRRPARLPQVPPAHRLALHRELPERRDRGQPAHHGASSSASSSCASTRRASATRRPRPRCARRSSRTSTRSTSLDHDRILRNQLGLIEATVRTNAYRSGRRAIAFKLSLGRRAGDPAAGAAVRDLRLLARGRGHPPARRQDRPRRPALVGPHGLPHRGLRPHARADDQERGHRAGRRQGRLLPTPAARRTRRRSRPRSSAST